MTLVDALEVICPQAMNRCKYWAMRGNEKKSKQELYQALNELIDKLRDGDFAAFYSEDPESDQWYRVSRSFLYDAHNLRLKGDIIESKSGEYVKNVRVAAIDSSSDDEYERYRLISYSDLCKELLHSLDPKPRTRKEAAYRVHAILQEDYPDVGLALSSVLQYIGPIKNK